MSIFRYFYLIKQYLENRKFSPARLIKSENNGTLYQTSKGYLYWLDEKRYIDQCIIEKGVFEPDTTKYLEKKIKKGFTVIDIGANIGYFTVMIAQLIGDKGKCYAFEPVNEYRRILKRNITTNKLKNVEVVSTGLSNKKTTKYLKIGTDSATLHWIGKTHPRGTKKVNLETLDNFIHKKKIEKIDLMKIDVDGHEPKIIAGAMETIKKHKPTMVLEVSYRNYKKAGADVKEFFKLLKSIGYKISYDFKPESTIDNADLFLKMYGDKSYSQNIIAEPI